MEEILQFSYMQQSSTFSFSFMQGGRFLVTYKFRTPEVPPRPSGSAHGAGCDAHVRKRARPAFSAARTSTWTSTSSWAAPLRWRCTT